MAVEEGARGAALILFPVEMQISPLGVLATSYQRGFVKALPEVMRTTDRNWLTDSHYSKNKVVTRYKGIGSRQVYPQTIMDCKGLATV